MIIEMHRKKGRLIFVQHFVHLFIQSFASEVDIVQGADSEIYAFVVLRICEPQMMTFNVSSVAVCMCVYSRCWHCLIGVLSATVACLKLSTQTNVSEVAGNISVKSFSSMTCWWYAKIPTMLGCGCKPVVMLRIRIDCAAIFGQICITQHALNVYWPRWLVRFWDVFFVHRWLITHPSNCIDWDSMLPLHRVTTIIMSIIGIVIITVMIFVSCGKISLEVAVARQ